jgi:hypothetical protein
MGCHLIFGNKDKAKQKLQVDLGDLKNEKEQLSAYLQLHLKVTVSQAGDKLTMDQEKGSAQNLQHAVTKYIYHKNLNSTHYASLEGYIVKINRFKASSKNKEKHKEEHQHQTAIQSWGL